MASDFQRRKVAGVFGAMDADRDGFLTPSDFAAVTQRWIGIRGWEPGSPQSTRMAAIMMGWWSGLQALADESRDEKVSLDEVMQMVDRLASMDMEVYGTADSMFEAIDADGDGVIEFDEHRQVVQAWKGSDAGLDDVFPKLDLNSDGSLSREEFRELWSDFWRGDDPAAPGQWIFGPYS